MIVGLPRDLVGPCRIGNALYGGGIERQHHHLNAVLVHQPQTPVVYVQKTALQLVPNVIGKRGAEVAGGFFNGNVFFERNLSLHCPVSGASQRRVARALSLTQAPPQLRPDTGTTGMLLAVEEGRPKRCPITGQRQRLVSSMAEPSRTV